VISACNSMLPGLFVKPHVAKRRKPDRPPDSIHSARSAFRFASSVLPCPISRNEPSVVISQKKNSHNQVCWQRTRPNMAPF